MPKAQNFAQTLRMWRQTTKGELVAVRAEAAALLATSLTQGGTFGPGTPVRTGRLLSGWTAQSRAGWTATLGTKGPEGDPRMQPAVQRARIPGWVKRVKTMAEKADLRIFTKVPYAVYVDQGHPTKRGFITTVRANWPRIVAAARLRAKAGAR